MQGHTMRGHTMRGHTMRVHEQQTIALSQERHPSHQLVQTNQRHNGVGINTLKKEESRTLWYTAQ